MKINGIHPREKGFILWGHGQNILDDPRISFLKLDLYVFGDDVLIS